MDDQDLGILAGEQVRAEALQTAKEKGVTLALAMTRLKQAMGAKETRVFCHQGEIFYSDPLIAHKVRLQATNLALQVLDAMPSEKHDHRVSLGANEMQLAAQIARKILHPTDPTEEPGQ